MVLPALADPPPGTALAVAGRELTYGQLRGAAVALARRLEGHERVAVVAEPELETAVALVAALLAGVALVPLNPKVGARELEHVLADAAPSLLLTGSRPPAADALVRLPAAAIDVTACDPGALPPEPDPEVTALVLYTSGTTGPPKGAVIARRAVTSNLDALAEAWQWTARDVLTHALPLFHAHGLVLGTIGPLRLGGAMRHPGRFEPELLARALATGATMLFAVPTMYARLAAAAEADPEVAAALGSARLLVSGSAALPAREHTRIERLCGQRVVERYGLTETLMNCAVRADGDRRPGYVGPALEGVEVRIVDEAGAEVQPDDAQIGEVLVRGPNLFSGYLNRPDATAAAVVDGWFRTGDLATRARDGYVRIVGRKSTDLIKTGGYKVGAGEVEAALLEHPAVAEVAVTGEPDDDLGERIVAWVVPVPGASPGERELADHVAGSLAPHKRPRTVHVVAELPRNDLGKIQKSRLRVP